MGHGTGWCGPPTIDFSYTPNPPLISPPSFLFFSVWELSRPIHPHLHATHTPASIQTPPPSRSPLLLSFSLSCNIYKKDVAQQRFSLCVLHNTYTHTHTQQQERGKIHLSDSLSIALHNNALVCPLVGFVPSNRLCCVACVCVCVCKDIDFLLRFHTHTH
jgi:hypothetical protein